MFNQQSNEPASQSCARLGKLDLIGAALAGIVYLSPLFLFSRIPTQDGPLHVDTAAVMFNSLGRHAPFLSTFFEIRWRVETNTLGHDLLVILFSVIRDPARSEKAIQIIYLALFFGGFAYFLAAVRRDSVKLITLGLPFAFSYLFHMGFLNYCLSMCGFLWCWGALLRFHQSSSKGDLVALTIAVLCTWLAHPVGLVAFGAGAIVFLAVRSALQLTRKRSSGERRSPLVLGLLLVLAIPLAGEFLFLFHRGGFEQWIFLSKAELAFQLIHLTSMDSFGLTWSPVAGCVAAVLSSCLFVMAAVRIFSRAKSGERSAKVDPRLMVVMTGFYTAVFFLAPADAAGSGLINERLMPCLFVFLVASVAAASFPRKFDILLSVIGLAALAALHIGNYATYRQAEAVEKDYLFALGEVPEESVVYPINLSSHGFDGRSYASYRTDFMAHMAAYYTVRTGGVYLNNTIARWNEGRQIGFKDPVFLGLHDLPAAFPGNGVVPLGFEEFRERVGHPVDYVLLTADFSAQEPLTEAYEEVLNKTFDCNHVSPLRLVKLCRSRSWTSQ
ncbi:MAG: hypothetical protein U0136_21325 [Bdellovibrionota bacterium]